MTIKYTYTEAFEKSKTYFSGNELSAKVFLDKYALKDHDENILEPTPAEMHNRLANEFARIDAEKYSLDFTERFDIYREAMDKFARIVPQGSPMAAIGNKYQRMSASNCVVVASPEDDMGSIIETGKELAQLYKRRCVEENSMVSTLEDGLIPIKNIKIGQHILSFDINNRKSTFKKVLNKFQTEVAEENRTIIKFSNGSILKTSKLHPILSLEQEYKYIEAGKLENNSISIKPEYQILTDNSFQLTNDTWGSVPNTDIGWIIGAHMGDGSCDIINNKHTGYNNKYRFRFLGDNENLVSEYTRIFNQLSESNRKYSLSSREDYKVDCWEYCNANNCNELIISLFFDNQYGKKTYSGKVPSYVSRNRLWWSFIAGLVDTDGWIKNDAESICLRLCAKNIIDEVVCFLVSQGVSCYTYVITDVRDNERPMYGLTIHGSEEFYHFFVNYLRHPVKKQKILDKITNVKEFSHKKYLTQKEYADIMSAYENSNIKKTGNIASCISLLRTGIDKKIGLGSLNEFVKSGVLSTEKKKEISQRIEVIEIIEDHDSTSYIDIEVEDTNNFYAGNYGLVNIHNCGVGVDISTLRPEGALVNNAARTTSGAWSFADFYSYITRMVGQNSRRGALMITMSIHHPDVLKFITMKHDLTKVTGANISLRLSNEFLEAVEKDEEYEVRWPVESTKPTVFKKIKAKEVWNTIIESATKTAEPGLIMWDNMINNLPAHCYPEFKTVSTNPSLRGDTLVATSEGVFPIKDLADNRKYVLVRNIDGEWKEASVFCSGKNKRLVEINFSNGQKIFCTEEHKWPILNSTNRIRNNYGKIIKKTSTDLKRLDKIYFPQLEKPIDNQLCLFNKEDGFVLGWNLGDGWQSFHKSNNSPQFGFLFSQEDVNSGIGNVILNYTNNLAKIASNLRRDHNSNSFTYCTTDKNVINRFTELGAQDKSNGIPSTIWQGNDQFIKGFVDGLFSSDASVRVTDRLSSSQIILVSSKKQIVEDVRKLLSFYGIRSCIRYSKSKSKFPKYNSDKLYDRYDLSISGLFVKKFASVFSLSNKNKQNKLNTILNMNIQYSHNNKISYANDRNYLVIKSVILTDLYEDVYDITVDDNTHTFQTEAGITGNCSEIALSAYDSCRLISINLTGYVKNAFTADARFDFDAFRADIGIGQQMADNLIDLELELIKKIQEVCQPGAEMGLWNKLFLAGFNGRRTGLGTHGLADTLAQLNIRYDSQAGLDMVEDIYRTLRDTAYEVSADLAKVRGAFPVYNYDQELSCEFITRLPQHILEKMKKYGRRNIAVLTQAPTGSVSILSKVGEFDQYNVSSGVEPVFRNSYIRRKKINPGDKNARVDYVDIVGDSWQEFTVFHSNVSNYFNVHPENYVNASNFKLPEYFVSSDEINWETRVTIQSIEQKYIDHSISSTINLPKGTLPQVVSKLYLESWKQGLKGVTVYVDGSRDGVLITKPTQNDLDESERPAKITVSMAPKRPKELQCDIHIATVKGVKWTVVVGLLHGDPYELFMGHTTDLSISTKHKTGKIVKVGKANYDLYIDNDTAVIKNIIKTSDDDESAWATRMISTSLRHGIPIEYLVEQLSKDGSVVDINNVLARILRRYIKNSTKKDACPVCGGHELVYEEKCRRCLDPNCGWNGCS